MLALKPNPVPALRPALPLAHDFADGIIAAEGRSMGGDAFATFDTPGWFMRLACANALHRQIKGRILGFVGFKPTRFSHFAGASHPKQDQVERRTEASGALGAKAA